ncbi:hypothetical protein ACK34P_18675, partial [Aeromonas veronii]
TSRSFWRYWVSATDKFIPKSGAECRLYTTRLKRVQSIHWRLNRTMVTTRVSIYFNCVWKQAIVFNSGEIKHLYILGCDFLFFIANKNPGGLILLHSTLYSSLTDPRHLLTV